MLNADRSERQKTNHIVTGLRKEGTKRLSAPGFREGNAAKGGAVGLWITAPLYAASLTTVGAFSILFAGGRGKRDAGFLAEAGGGVWLTLVATALVVALVGSADRLRFVLVLPAAALYPVSLLRAFRNLVTRAAVRSRHRTRQVFVGDREHSG